MADTRRFARLRTILRLVLLVVIPLLCVAGGLVWYAGGGRLAETDNAYVKSHIVIVAPEVSGRVIEVAVRDNQSVAPGALLFRIDPAPFQLAMAKAEAQMSIVRTEVGALRAEYRAALIEADEVEERIRFLTRQLERQRALKDKGMGREDVFDEARHNLEVARRRLSAAHERAQRALASLAGDAAMPIEQHPRYRDALNARDVAALDLRRTRVMAPTAGVVSNVKLDAGEQVEKGRPVFSLVASTAAWIEANFKETQLTNMRVGQSATVVADAYPDVVWRARVNAIAPATGAEFALLPPQNATGNWVKIVQRVPVHLTIEHESDKPPLRAGMTVTASVDTGRERGLPRWVQTLLGPVNAFQTVRR